MHDEGHEVEPVGRGLGPASIRSKAFPTPTATSPSATSGRRRSTTVSTWRSPTGISSAG